ncbi:hypothetical protein A6M21_02920 [Desulfotomaculum copahuensis]|uniref:Uncharacterized protein n=1 Tax=Desulfotomaculum copahuensis TaxID=1838280 RepID=A0A1B7LIM8_9FIRM|nr:hypothetical protein A6M21_02920 [Desulfotomaculum copahuensis]
MPAAENRCGNGRPRAGNRTAGGEKIKLGIKFSDRLPKLWLYRNFARALNGPLVEDGGYIWNNKLLR